MQNYFKIILLHKTLSRDVSTGATSATLVAPKFSDTLTLCQPGGKILPAIAEVAPKFSPQLRPCLENVCWNWRKQNQFTSLTVHVVPSLFLKAGT